MEFVEAPAFSRRRADYLDDDRFSRLQAALGNTPEIGDLMPGTGGSAKCDGRMRGAARDAEAGCGSSNVTFRQITKYGS